jgi:hypothetical protein
MDKDLPTEPVQPIDVPVAEPELSVLDPVDIETPVVEAEVEKKEPEVPAKHRLIVTVLAFFAIFLLAILIGILAVG